jgi:hypothetical protein
MNISRAWLAIGAALVLGVAVAQGVKQLSVSLAGKTLKLDSVVVGGKTYVSLEQLRKALPSTAAAGGATQVAAVNGCIGELLFNGAWRFRVQKLEWNASEGAWQIALEIRNGMTKIAMPVRSGANFGGQDMSLIQASGNTLNVGTNQGNTLDNTLLYKQLAPGAGVVTNVLFYTDSDADKPTKFLWAMSAASNQDRAPISKDPAFRVDLTCQK